MKTIGEIQDYKRKSHHPLTIDGRNVLELADQDPQAAHRLIAETIDKRGGHRPLFEYRNRQGCIRQAMSKPLPGASDAILKDSIQVGSRQIRPVVPVHFAVLQGLDSPLLKLIADATENKKAALVNPTQEQKWEICHVFTEDPKTLFKAFKSKGADFIREQSADAVGMIWQAAEIELAMPAIMEQLKRHIETTVKFAAEMEAKGDVSFFREEKSEALKPAA
jgi:hypothetical protein